MSMPIEKDYPNSMEIMDIKEAKKLQKNCKPLLDFIEDTSQTHSKKIAADLYKEIKTFGSGFYECVLATSVIEAYAKESHYKVETTNEILESIADHIAKLLKEKGYTVDSYIDDDCAYFEISGWGEE